MGKTTIEWTDYSFNPWVGCTKVSAACDHCYAESWAKRAGSPELWQGERRRTTAANWRNPLKWNRQAADDGIRRRVFCASLADVFDNQVPLEWQSDLWALVEHTPNLDWLLLTKRPQNIVKLLPGYWLDNMPENVWLGTTCENQEEAERRIPHLLAVPARVLFLSCEPLLGKLDLWQIPGAIYSSVTNRCVTTPGIEPWECAEVYSPLGWAIGGGESGPKARDTDPDLFRDLRDQCRTYGIAYFHKQMAHKAPIPDDLMVREMPDTSGSEKQEK